MIKRQMGYMAVRFTAQRVSAVNGIGAGEA